MPQNSKMLIGAVIAAALAFAVYYGLIGQQTATSIQNQANQTLGTTPVQQTTPAPPQTPPTPAPTGPVTQNPPTAPTPIPAPPGPTSQNPPTQSN